MAKKQMPRWKKILFWILGILTSIILIIVLIGYFYWSQLIKGIIVEEVAKQSKGLYVADIDRVYYDIFGGDLYIRGITLNTDTVVYNELKKADSAPSMLFQLNMEKLNVNNLHLKNIIFNKIVDIKDIMIKSPEMKITIMQKTTKDTLKTDTNITQQQLDTTLSIPLPKSWKSIKIGQILLETGSLAILDKTKDTTKEYSIPYFDIRIENLWIDSTWNTDPRIYNTDDIRITLREISQKTGNEMYEMHFGEVGIWTSQNLVYIDHFYLEPLFNRHDFSRKLGYQSDRMDLQVEKISLSGISWHELMIHKRLIAGKLQVDSLLLDDYRDKRVPMRPGFKPPMPQQLIRNLKQYIWIDSLKVVNGKATYSEQVANEPGTIFFDRINGLLKGLTNDSTWLAEGKVSPLTAEAYLQGSGKLKATINFIFGDTRNRFSVSAKLSSFDLPGINTMLSKLIPAEIESGRVQKMVIPMIQFNDDYSEGKLTFYYNDLSFKMFKDKNTAWDGIKTGVINFVASDFLIHKSNPRSNGKLHSGIIYFQRDKHKSIINFVWKSIFSGLKSNMGFNSKEQKAIKKGNKKSDKKSKK